MTAIFESLLPVALIVALGAGLRRSSLMPDELWLGLERVAYWIFFPAILIHSLAQADLKTLSLTGITLTLMSAVSAQCLLVWLLRPALMGAGGVSGPAYTTIFQTATRWNLFIALAIIARSYGQEGITLVAVAIAAMVPILNPVNTIVVAVYASDTRPSARRIVVAVARNPFIWSCAIGIAINLLGIPVYGPLMTTLDILGRSALGAGLLLVGAGLVLRQAVRPSLELIAPLVLRLFVLPLIVAGFAYLFGVTGTALHVALICAAVPTAMNGYVLARQMGGDAPLYAAVATAQTIVSFFTIPLVLWLLG